LDYEFRAGTRGVAADGPRGTGGGSFRTPPSAVARSRVAHALARQDGECRESDNPVQPVAVVQAVGDRIPSASLRPEDKGTPYHWLDFTPPRLQIAAAPVEDFVTAAHRHKRLEKDLWAQKAQKNWINLILFTHKSYQMEVSSVKVHF
jgi:hypothetical protein